MHGAHSACRVRTLHAQDFCADDLGFKIYPFVSPEPTVPSPRLFDKVHSTLQEAPADRVALLRLLHAFSRDKVLVRLFVLVLLLLVRLTERGLAACWAIGLLMILSCADPRVHAAAVKLFHELSLR
jgi:hypothetical protein